MNKKISAHIALSLVALIYGANYSIAKIVMDEDSFSSIALLGFRLLSGAGIFSLIYFIFIRQKIDLKDLGLIVLCGLSGTGLNMGFFLYGLDHTTAINASLVMTTVPVIVLVLSSVLLKTSLNKFNILGVFIALIGAIYLIYRPDFGFSIDKIKGDLSIFLNGSFYALYLVLVKKLISKYNPITLLMLFFTVGLITIFPFTLTSISDIEWSELNNMAYLAFAFVLIFTTCFTYLLNAFALQYVTSTLAGVYIYLQPLVAAIFAIVIRNEEISLKIIASSSLIFAGLYLVSIKK